MGGKKWLTMRSCGTIRRSAARAPQLVVMQINTWGK